MKILTDLSSAPVNLSLLISQAREIYGEGFKAVDGWEIALDEFMSDRQQHLLERRGHAPDTIRAVRRFILRLPADALVRAEALGQARKTPGFESLASLFKRVKNITKDFTPTAQTLRPFVSQTQTCRCRSPA